MAVEIDEFSGACDGPAHPIQAFRIDAAGNSARVAHDKAIAADQFHLRVSRKDITDRSQVLWRPKVIGIQKSNVRPSSRLDPKVARVSQPGMRFLQVNPIPVLSAELLGNFLRIVRRTVIDNEKLKVGKCL